MIALGLFSLATTITARVQSLLLARVLAGIGLGGAFPTLIALVSEIASSRSRVTALACMYCGLPIGGATAGLVAALASSDWRYIFYIGGLGPVLLAPVLARYLFSVPVAHPCDASDGSYSRISSIFGSRTLTTLLLWTGYFFTLLVVYLLLNWLPSLARGRGYSHAQASTSVIVLNCGAVIGSLLLGVSGTGVGAAVAAGRMGSIVGPLIGGSLLASGFGPGIVPAAAIRGLAIALMCLLWLLRLNRAGASS